MNDDVKTRIDKLVASAADISDILERSRKYKNIVALISQEAVRSNDWQDIDYAKKIAGLVTDDPSKAYLEIVRAIAKINRKDKNLFDEAVKITGKIDNDLDLSVALSEIITAFGKYGIGKKDDVIYSDSFDLIEKIPLNTYRAMAYRNISQALASIDRGKSLEFLDKSIDILENSKGIKTEYLVKAFCETGSILASLNDKRSRRFIKKAIDISSDLVDDFDRSAVLLKIVETELEIGIKLNDQELIKEASVISKGITKEFYKTIAKNSLKKRPILLMILDGYGLSDKKEGNAILAAKTPTLDRLFLTYPHSILEASGMSVGLPEGQMGNSEVGHLNIGAGRIVYQDLTRITKSIRDGDFSRNVTLIRAIENAKKNDSSLHLIGLLSDGGVHSHNTHLYALLELAKKHGLSKVFVHAFLDGRDVPPKSALSYIADAEKKMRELGGQFATISGRYFAMDRDKRWERVEKAYDIMTMGAGAVAQSAAAAVQNAYERGETDEFVIPTVIKGNITENNKQAPVIMNDDSVIFFNFRSDRAREITRALTNENFNDFNRKIYPHTHFVCMTQYDETFNLPVAFQSESLINILADILSKEHLRQLRIAETEKYAHVTFFFNGGREEPVEGEERILVPSPKVVTYDMQPEMSAYPVTDEVEKAVSSGKYDVIILNYANLDMVGHTGIFDAAVSAVETIDICIGRVEKAVRSAGGILIVTADHGNAEQMLDGSGGIQTAHTCDPVPFLFCDTSARVRNGILADIAPTLLEILGIEKPTEMTGKSLILPS